jgi:large subunit ribosomal protein L21
MAEKTVKKAVIMSGGKQYLVSEGETLDIDLLGNDKQASFEALMVIDGEKITVGTPVVTNIKVSAEIVEQDVKAEKVTAIRYKAKKRVRKVRGHRQHHSRVKISKIG